MVMDDTTLGIIVPVYNVEKYLKDCINSILKQTRMPDQIILVDDGSVDSSGKLCDAYAAQHDRISVIHKSNGGLSDARNEGIKACNCDYLMFVDSDDVIVQDACERIMDCIIKSKPEVLVCGIESVYPDKIVGKTHYNTDASVVFVGQEFLLSEIKHRCMFYESVQSIYSKKYIMENDLFFEKGLLHEDQIFTAKVLTTAQRVVSTQIVFYKHMIRAGSITTQIDQTPNAISIIRICGMFKSLLPQIRNDELAQVLMDHAIDLYYQAFINAKLITKPQIRLNSDFLKKYSYSRKNRIRTAVYLANEHLFVVIEKTRKRLG